MVEKTDTKTLQAFVVAAALAGATVYSDGVGASNGLPFEHKTVGHSIGECARQQAHINGMEFLWATLKRGCKGTFHHISPKHLHRHVNEFATRHNLRARDTEATMRKTVARMVGKRLMYRELIDD